MSLDIHRRAELLMGQADQLLIEGRPDEAARLYRDAAAAEARVVEILPSDRPKTRGIIAISSVVLYRKAGLLEQAIRQAHQFLGRDDLPEFSRLDLEDLLEEMRAERLLNAAGQTLSDGAFEWILRGSQIGPGMAPISVIAKNMDQIARFGVRVFECLVGAPVRKAGSAPPEIVSAFDMVMAQPYAGSFRFQVRFTTPARQLPLFDAPFIPKPSEVGRFFGDVLEATTSEDPGLLESIVQDEQYKDAFLRSVRSMIPSGKDVGTVDIVGHGSFAETSLSLTPDLSKRVTQRIIGLSPNAPSQATRTDVLRGFDLNEGWIRLGRDKATAQSWYVRDGVILDDIVEDLVNQTVRVTGHWVKRGRGRRFLIDDLEAVERPDGDAAFNGPI